MIKLEKTKKLSGVYNYLVLLFPISLIFSNLISELIVGILIFSFLMKNSSISKLKLYINFFVKLFFIFFLILIISSLLSENIALSIKKSISYLRFILFSFAICWVLDNQKKLLINLLKTSILIIFCLQHGVISDG